MSQPYSAVSRRCFRAFAPAAAVFAMTVGGIAVANVLPERLMGVEPTPAVIAIPPPAPAPPPLPPPPEFSFAAPLPGHDIGSPFGLRRLPWEPSGRMHEGVDIAARSGLPVLATTAGTVTRAGSNGSYGRFVEVAHADGFSSLYAHLGRAAKGIKAGDPITAGQAVGYVGNSGHSTGAHLHFELRKDGKAMNPAMFLGRQFATAAELPLKAAAHVSRQVRLAQVSATPRWAQAGVQKVSRKGGKKRVHAVIASAD